MEALGIGLNLGKGRTDVEASAEGCVAGGRVLLVGRLVDVGRRVVARVGAVGDLVILGRQINRPGRIG